MAVYRAPVEDWQFLLHEVLQVERHRALPGFADLDRDLTEQIWQAAADFHAEVLHPMNLAADAQGARIEDGRVSTPTPYPQAWRAYREAGWHRLGLSEGLGGAGLPPVMGVPITELRASCGHSFSMYSSFCAPTAHMLARLGTDWMRQWVVPRLVSGEWTATMCMTEPQAGTDLRQLTTRATRREDGTWRITGRKIFISGGDHDLTDNIVHVVLAKVAQADGSLAPGLASVHVFLVSKRRLNTTDGSLGAIQGVHARSIEHKMGIEGSATCAMEFDQAEAWLLSDPTQTGSAASMAPMFYLMNYARVGTALSGVAYSEIARQNAAAYARERLSGRAHHPPARPDLPADPIIEHPDVRRQLLEARAFTEGARAAAMRAALWQSLAEHDPDPAVRAQSSDLLDLMTPVMKAYFTDAGFAATVSCQQVLGGHGYIRDYGLEQYVRNARIGQLYEGANGIQATDFVQRKLPARGGRALQSLGHALTAALARHGKHPSLQAWVDPVQRGWLRLERSLQWVLDQQGTQPLAVTAGAYDLLTATGILLLAWNWLEIVAALPPSGEQASNPPAWHQRKRALAQLWMQRQLPLLYAHCERAESGNACLLALPEALV